MSKLSEEKRDFNFLRFKNRIKDFASFQKVFKNLQNSYYKKEAQVIELENKQLFIQENFKKWSKELKERECEALGLNKAIEVMEVKTVRKLYEKKLYSVEERIEALNKALNKYNLPLIAEYFMIQQGSEFDLQSIEWLARRAGEWFETGALGEGSVSFNGKTYRYKKRKVTKLKNETSQPAI